MWQREFYGGRPGGQPEPGRGIESANLTRSGGRSARQQETPTKTNNLTRRQGTRVGIQGHGRQLTLQGKIHQGRKQS